MRTTLITILLAAGALVMSAQIGQDLKHAGEATKDAATTGTEKTKDGTKHAYHSSTHAVKKGAHKTATETEKGADKVRDKTSDTGTH